MGILETMSDVLDQIEYTTVSGPKSDHTLRLYSLSTCAFCRRAMKYLEEHGFEYAYVHLDRIDFEVKREAKKELKEKYEDVPVFPILTVDGQEAISGFLEEKWAALLGIT